MKKYMYWLPVFLWMTIIFSLSSRQRISVSEVESLNFLFFKSLHIIEYAILFFFTYRALSFTTKWTSDKNGVVAFVITMLYAISDEFHQTLVPTREGHVRDVIIDGIGAMIAWLKIKYILPKMPKKLLQLLKQWHLISF